VHEELGAPSLAVTMLRAGSTPNVLPADAKAVIDIRWTPNSHGDAIEQRLREQLGHDVEIERLCCLEPVVGSGHGDLLDGLVAAGSPRYFTDLSALARPGDSILILGPGEPGYAHALDERCSVELIGEAAAIYRRLLAGSPAG
jgi:succinyl-diaminopimelate desuccinylase